MLCNSCYIVCVWAFSKFLEFSKPYSLTVDNGKKKINYGPKTYGYCVIILQITISECFPIAGILITKKLKVGVHILISCVQFEINFTIISYIVFQYLYTVTAYIYTGTEI
jgi:hypothetical protein